MNKLLRTLWTLLASRRRSKLGILDVGVIRMRVRPTDLDLLRHMNNGVYFSVADLGRYDLLIRAGVAKVFSERGWYPVVASSTISYRKSLDAGMRYELHSRLLGIDEKATYLEQRFVVDGEIYARLFVRARFLKRTGGPVSTAELAEAIGIEVLELRPPAWVERWAEDVALPSTKSPAPNDWA